MWFIWALSYTSMCSMNENLGSCFVAIQVYSTPSFWFAILLITVTCILPEILVH